MIQPLGHRIEFALGAGVGENGIIDAAAVAAGVAPELT